MRDVRDFGPIFSCLLLVAFF
uniref:Disease resistance protein RGA2-like n=1 Tax=Rhizophora mucronata TaxID=61149 RepID=A0A2P2MWY5_RHIMU